MEIAQEWGFFVLGTLVAVVDVVVVIIVVDVVVVVAIVVARQLVAKVANFDDGSKLFKIKNIWNTFLDLIITLCTSKYLSGNTGIA